MQILVFIGMLYQWKAVTTLATYPYHSRFKLRYESSWNELIKEIELGVFALISTAGIEAVRLSEVPKYRALIGLW